MLPTFRTPYAYDLSSTNTPATTDTTLALPIGIGRQLPPRHIPLGNHQQH
jgi:hypothetical protein